MKPKPLNECVVKHQTAKLAYSVGFRDCYGSLLGKAYYNHKGQLNGDMTLSLREVIKKVPEENRKYKPIAAPTQSLLYKWLREKTGVLMNVHMDEDGQYYYKLSDCDIIDFVYPTYEEAFENGLIDLLNKCKNDGE